MSTKRLTQKEKGLIAVGAAIAAGCQPCTVHHFKAVRQSGATEEEIRQAVADASCVRNNATKIMSGLAEKLLDDQAVVQEMCCSLKPLMGELVSIGAALAVNCTTNLETHLQAARQAGATDSQIQTALGIARAIKKVAEQKVEAVIGVTGAKMDVTIHDNDDRNQDNACQPGTDSGGCGCGEKKKQAATASIQAITEPCGCA